MDSPHAPAYAQLVHWNDLQVFLAVARFGQLARAAAALGVDATTVGRRLRRLEQELEQTLFEQTRVGQTLTEAGERLLLRVEAMEHAASEIGNKPADGQGLSGLLRISVSEGFGTWFVAQHLRSFTEANPGLTVDLVANSGFLSPSRRETDVAVLLARPRKGPLVSRKLSDYCLRLYASRAYLERHAGMIDDAAELRAHPLIGYIPDFIYAPELRYMDDVAPGLALTIRSSSINAQYRLTAAGAGISVLPCFIGDEDPQLVRIVPDVRIMRSFWLVTHEDTRRLGRIVAFSEWMTDLVQRQRERLLGRDRLPG
ncbi:MAG: transcriptional regulator, LysR family [Alphaproteobacteria bacterium]|nr:transcriptional regulator, LysR family [Alphaproteobacteria bacterium]